MKHVIYFNTKGGVGKSTLCEFSAKELSRLGYSVNVGNTDQQVHVTPVDEHNPDYFLYDTAGAFTGANIDLLEAASLVDSLIIVPMNTGLNDFKEVPFLVEKLTELDLLDRVRVVFTKARSNSKSLSSRRSDIEALGLRSLKWSMPTLEDFSEQRYTSRTRNEISAFLHEVLL